MRALLVYPEFPLSYWGFQYGLDIIKKRASLPPLGLVTVAACLPQSWEMRLVDLNVRELTDDDLAWAGVVLVGGMLIQSDSMREVIARARRAGRRVVAGGPAPTTSPERFAEADVVFQGEVEGRADELVQAIESSGPVRIGPPAALPLMSLTPVPRFDLLDFSKYVSMSIQYSRGCPFRCEFCDIIEMFGRVPRVKSVEQVLAELDRIHALGHRGTVFFVDDNFIGNRRTVKALLPEIAEWQRRHGVPFELYTEASVNLASDPELVSLMVRARFSAAFLGIESPSNEALERAGKTQNVRIDTREAVDTLTRAGIEVMGGFIVGFDQDDRSIFEAQRQFIASSPIPLAMIGVLSALPGTALTRRLAREGRLRGTVDGDQFARPNFEPRMDEVELLSGYRDLLADIYSADSFYARCHAYLDLAPAVPGDGTLSLSNVVALLRTVVGIGVRSTRRAHFWRLLGKAVRKGPAAVRWAIAHAIQGEHLVRYTQEHVVPRLNASLAEMSTQTAHTSRMRPAPLTKIRRSRADEAQISNQSAIS